MITFAMAARPIFAHTLQRLDQSEQRGGHLRVERLDHVHIEVADRDVAAGWYQRVLGLERHPDLAQWKDDPIGPLILAGADGFPTLSLFARDCKDPSRDATVAFRVSGEDFAAFCKSLDGLGLTDGEGAKLTPDSVVDHELSWSVYFVDPDGNRLEVTTYDYDLVAGTR
ncbi:MAG: VOC family protein [Pseudomonadota bacterium]